MSLHAFDLSKQQSEEEKTKTVTFEFKPEHLMCMHKCGTAITKALSSIGIKDHNIEFNIDEHLMRVTVPESMPNDTIIERLKFFGREARVYSPRTKVLGM